MAEAAEVAKVVARSRERGAIVAGDQGSHRGHQCSETSLAGEPGSIVRVGFPQGRKPLFPRWGANGCPTRPV